MKAETSNQAHNITLTDAGPDEQSIYPKFGRSGCCQAVKQLARYLIPAIPAIALLVIIGAAVQYNQTEAGDAKTKFADKKCNQGANLTADCQIWLKNQRFHNKQTQQWPFWGGLCGVLPLLLGGYAIAYFIKVYPETAARISLLFGAAEPEENQTLATEVDLTARPDSKV